jgi:hypothetical protein
VRLEGLEGHPLEVVEMAEAKEPLPDPGAHVGLAAGAELELAELGMPQRPVEAKVTEPVAKRAIGIADVSLLGSGPNAVSVR